MDVQLSIDIFYDKPGAKVAHCCRRVELPIPLPKDWTAELPIPLPKDLVFERTLWKKKLKPEEISYDTDSGEFRVTLPAHNVTSIKEVETTMKRYEEDDWDVVPLPWEARNGIYKVRMIGSRVAKDEGREVAE